MLILTLFSCLLSSFLIVHFNINRRQKSDYVQNETNSNKIVTRLFNFQGVPITFRPQVRTLNPIFPATKPDKQQPVVENKHADVEALEAEAAKWLKNKQKEEAERKNEEAKKSQTPPSPPPPPPPEDSDFPIPPPPPPPLESEPTVQLLESNEYLEEAPTPPPGGKILSIDEDKSPEFTELPHSDSEQEEKPATILTESVIPMPTQPSMLPTPEKRIFLPHNPLHTGSNQILLRPIYRPVIPVYGIRQNLIQVPTNSFQPTPHHHHHLLQVPFQQTTPFINNTRLPVQPRFVTMQVPPRPKIQEQLEQQKTAVLKVSENKETETKELASSSKSSTPAQTSSPKASNLIKSKIEWRRTSKTNKSSNSETSIPKRCYVPDWLASDIERVAKKKAKIENEDDDLMVKYLMGNILKSLTDEEIKKIVESKLKNVE